jgi:RNA ligase (TIGR02306 family)
MEQADRQKNKIKKFLSRYSWFRRLFGRQRESFPRFISKTDEDRIQLFPHICETEKQVPFEVTEKLDGQSGTWFLVRHKSFLFGTKFSFGVCSRRLLLKRPDNSSYWEMARKYHIEQALKNIIGDYEFVAIQGEICGPRIQGNKYGLNENEMFAFNLIYPDGKVNNMISKEILISQGINFVPVLSHRFFLADTITDMLDLSNGESALNTNVLREGMVLRNYEKGLSFKVVSPEFLLKYGE